MADGDEDVDQRSDRTRARRPAPELPPRIRTAPDEPTASEILAEMRRCDR